MKKIFMFLFLVVFLTAGLVSAEGSKKDLLDFELGFGLEAAAPMFSAESTKEVLIQNEEFVRFHAGIIFLESIYLTSTTQFEFQQIMGDLSIAPMNHEYNFGIKAGFLDAGYSITYRSPSGFESFMSQIIDERVHVDIIFRF